MTFPAVQDLLEQGFSTAVENHAIDLPATVNAGELLLVSFTSLAGAYSISEAGWTTIYSDDNGDVFLSVLVGKIADGTEGGGQITVRTETNFSGGLQRTFAAQVYRIGGWSGDLNDIEWAVDKHLADNIIDDPNPPSLAPSWGAVDTLWIPFVYANDDDAALISGPTNYTNATNTVSGAGTDAGCSVLSARRELNAASEDPGVFTLAQEEKITAYTVAVRPGSSGLPDTTAPTFSAGPSAVNVSQTTFDVQATLDENGTIYSVVVADGATAPTSTEVKNGQESGGGAPLDSGSTAATGGSAATIGMSGLSAGTAYDVYTAAEDGEGNLQSSPTLTNATTSAIQPPSISTSPSTIVRTGTGYVITGTDFGSVQGTGNVTLETSGGGTVVTQGVETWTDTQIEFTAIRGALPLASDLVLRVSADGGADDSVTGVTLRNPQISETIEDDDGNSVANESSIEWWVRPDRSSAAVDEGAAGATDGSGNIELTLANSTAAPGDTVVADVKLADGRYGQLEAVVG